MWKCKKVYLTRGRLGEQLSDLEMSQQVGSSAEKRSRRNGPQRQFSTSSRLGSAKCSTPCASGSTPSAASPRSRTCSVEQSALPASKNSKLPSERRRNLSGHPVGRVTRPGAPQLRGPSGPPTSGRERVLSVRTFLGAFFESAPPSLPQRPGRGAAIPSPCRRAAQPPA